MDTPVLRFFVKMVSLWIVWFVTKNKLTGSWPGMG